MDSLTRIANGEIGREEALSLLSDQKIQEDLRERLKEIEKDPVLMAQFPNSEVVALLYNILLHGENTLPSRTNRHEQIETMFFKNQLKFTRTNPVTGTTQIIKVKDKHELLQGKAPFIKMFAFVLERLAIQSFPRVIGFSLQEMVDRGMYSSIRAARREVQEFWDAQRNLVFSGQMRRKLKGGKTEEVVYGEAILFSSYKIKDNFVTMNVDENLNAEFMAAYYTGFPRFAYGLKKNAFLLTLLIFQRARFYSKAIKDYQNEDGDNSGAFNINLDTVRAFLGLPEPDEVSAGRYKQLIISPLQEAVKEITENLPEKEKNMLDITFCNVAGRSIREWLQDGYLSIGLKKDFAKSFVAIAEKRERKTQ